MKIQNKYVFRTIKWIPILKEKKHMGLALA